METDERIKEFRKFLEQSHHSDLVENVRKGDHHLVIDFSDLSKSSPDLAEELLEEPEDVLAAGELAVKEFDLPNEVENFQIRVRDMPESARVRISEIRSKHLNKMVWTKGTVRQKSDVKPKAVSAKFECPSCGNVITVLQTEKKFKRPDKCSCGRKGKFKELSKELIDAQRVIVEEASEDLEGGEQPKRINAILKRDLASPLKERESSPGSKIQISGWVTEIPQSLQTGGKSTEYDLLLNANHMEAVEENYKTMEITEEEEQEIKDLANDPNIYEKLIQSIAPSVYGYDRIKQALLFQFVGGVHKDREDGTESRGDLHILLIGDPGAGKSMLLKRAQKVAPKSRYVTGKGTSGAGLCVAPDSLIMKNPGEMEEIKPMVEKQLSEKSELHSPGAIKGPGNDNVWSLNNDLSTESSEVDNVWKLEPPEEMVEVKTRTGKKLEITPNTKLMTIENGETEWKKSMNIQESDYIATPRRLPESDNEEILTLSLIDSDVNIYGVEKEINKVLNEVDESKKEIAEKLEVSEDCLYYGWINEDTKGCIGLDKLEELCEITDNSLSRFSSEVEKISLRNGHKIKIPEYITPNFAYFAGLISGDGDIQKDEDRVQIRFHNSNPELLEEFKKLCKELFDIETKIEETRTTKCIRFGSKPIGEILNKVGIPNSPKKDDLDIKNNLISQSNKHIAKFLQGLYDTDGSVNTRNESRGSSQIGFYTVSEKLARKIQLLLLRFGIKSKLRERKPSKGTKEDGDIIEGNLTKYSIIIRGKKNFKKFYEKIGFNSEKQEKLKNEIENLGDSNTNTDVIPTLNKKLVRILKQYDIPTKKIYSSKKSHYDIKNYEISYEESQRILDRLEEINEEAAREFSELVNTDIFWDQIKEVKTKENKYEYVYDLTAEDTHNFISNGILVHNTASVVRDEFLGGWSLEAGAIVLSNEGFVMIDELDKMGTEDRSAMHEALEQQCYHPSTEIMLGSGEKVNIKELVDGKMSENEEDVVDGVNCEILEVDDLSLATTDFESIGVDSVDRVSRHEAPDKFVNIMYSNGRSIKVTPEHPTFVFNDGEVETIRADSVEEGMLAPSPVKYPSNDDLVSLEGSFYDVLDENISRFLGYHVTEGYSSKNTDYRTREIGVCNTDEDIIEEVEEALSEVGVDFSISRRNAEDSEKATEELVSVRVCSHDFYDFFESNFSETLKKSTEKRVPDKIMKSPTNIKVEFLKSAFKGDGFIDSERFGYSTSSRKCAEDYQDLLLSCGIWNRIVSEEREDNEYYKVVISGTEMLKRFNDLIVSDSDDRSDKIDYFVSRSENRNNTRDIVPNSIVSELKESLSVFNLDDGYFYKHLENEINAHKSTVRKYVHLLKGNIQEAASVLNPADPKTVRKKSKIEVSEVADKMGVSPSTIYNIEADSSHDRYEELRGILIDMSMRKIEEVKNVVDKVESFIESSFRFVRVEDVEEVNNEDVEWVYDVTVEPDNTFLSDGLVLHNTVSISKANIQATLQAETTVLAAANPKLGRFNPMDPIASQIDLPPTLINRFDLIFPIKDLPDKEKDEGMAKHILGLHRDPQRHAPEIDEDLLTKYISYVRKNVQPRIGDDALQKIKDYYVEMRSQDDTEGEGFKTIPITARQLEALIRMAEASAKIRLADEVSVDDAKRAIDLLEYCLDQVARDSETGEIDIDRISSDVSATERNKIMVVKDIINDLEEQLGKTIPIEELVEEGEEQGLSKEEVEEAIEKLKRQGDLFEPKRGSIQRIV